jgi:YhcH/YjgK/YiaL family protein
MVLDHVQNADRYVALHPRFAEAFRFLTETHLTDLAPGRHEVDGDRLYAMVIRAPGTGCEEARLEAHRRYIDIQYSVDTTDVIGWRHAPTCGLMSIDEEKDVGFSDAEPNAWVAVAPRMFAVFFPEDAHAPMGGEGELHKVVMKVAVES